MKATITTLILSVLTLTYALAANYYWVGGSGNWSDYANHWATSSGGSIFNLPSTDNS